MADIPLLPEPGFQSPEDRRVIARRFILQARHYLEQRDRLQAGEKAWGAIAHNLKVIGEQRGWNHGSHQQIENIGRQIVVECQALYPDLGEAISDVFHYGHRNFYENMRSIDEMRETVAWAEEAIGVLEEVQHIAPRPFTITSNTQLRRLRALTGNNGLQIGDSSPVGFSLKHTPDSHGNEAAAE
jgi:hypothetical protein